MNKTTLHFAALLSLLILHGCAAPVESGTNPPTTGQEAIRLFEGLVGEWVDAPGQDSTIFHEQWQRHNASHYEGIGYVMLGNDTVSIEHLNILVTDTGTFYTAEMPGQNEGRAVYFRLTSATDSLVFENPQHDFPQRIVYLPQGRKGWIANVSGPMRGEMRSMRFELRPREKGTK